MERQKIRKTCVCSRLLKGPETAKTAFVWDTTRTKNIEVKEDNSYTVAGKLDVTQLEVIKTLEDISLNLIDVQR
jgi:hypothetical protein